MVLFLFFGLLVNASKKTTYFFLIPYQAEIKRSKTIFRPETFKNH